MPSKDLTLMPKELMGARAAGGLDFNQLFRFAQVCHASGLFEDVSDAAQAFAKIAKGQELGLPPMASMSGIDIVGKRLFIKPWIVAAQINGCGYGSYQVVEQTSEQCTIQFSKKYAGRGWIKLPPVSYALAEARAHGLVDRSKHWKANPAHMLYQRAMGRGGAMYFPELLAGLRPPQDDAPVPADRHAQNIVDLFGDDPRGSTPIPPAHPQEASSVPQEGVEDTALASGVVGDAHVPDAPVEPLMPYARRHHLCSLVLQSQRSLGDYIRQAGKRAKIFGITDTDAILAEIPDALVEALIRDAEEYIATQSPQNADEGAPAEGLA